MSTGLDDDARSAYQHFRRQARALGTISSSFDALALVVTAAYLEALARPSYAAWAMLVRRAAVFAQRARALRTIVAFDVREREALDFFEAIVRENADLLIVHQTLATPSNLDAPQRALVS
ncbi:MAG: hypothetical protein ABSB70_16305 [Candidatus Velthaea sp.]|jgi:hypothetical protein